MEAEQEAGQILHCNNCSFTTSSAKILSTHCRQVHFMALKKMICRECQFSTVDKQIMAKHILDEHKGNQLHSKPRQLIRCKEDRCNFESTNPEEFR